MTQITRITPITSPSTKSLASVIARAKATMPAVTGQTAAARARPTLTILADTSASMDRKAGKVRRIDALGKSLELVQRDTPSAVTLAFSSLPRPLRAGAPLPEPDGGTALHLALDAADPPRVLVISDGDPDSAPLALSVARRMAGTGVTIDTLFIGDDGDTRAIAFMRELSQIGRGRAVDLDISKAQGDTARLTSAIKLLAAPR